ncbi:hypothetical protein GGF32_000173 [Allomyces javanicus]|nr:hypothetical protein GGF32_000173 [Allomyces javanicus]
MADQLPQEKALIHAPRPPLAGKHHGSFAFYTIRDRLPVILTKVIDDVYRTIVGIPDDESVRIAEGKAVIERIAALRYAMQRDKPIPPIEDTMPDVTVWNDFLDTYWKGQGHFQVAWLFQECYMYRKIREAFALTTTWTTYDPFLREKQASLAKGLDVLGALSHHVAKLHERAQDPSTRTVALAELLVYSLWGNAVDLSLLVAANNVDMAALGAKLVKKGTEGVVANDLDVVVAHLAGLHGKRIDLVLDNAGFELAADLFLADWLVASGIASQVVFHVKSIPWFVSDTTTTDFHATLADLSPIIPTFVTRWQSHLASGAWRLHEDPFWTYPHAYYHLPSFPIFDTLSNADLVVFKGDLNYRKLVFDCSWDPTTSFAEAIGPLGQKETKFPPLVSLRTCKSDVCVGLSPSKVAEMNKVKDWMVSGHYAVISSANFPAASRV